MTLVTIFVCCLATVFTWRTNRSVRGMTLFAVGFLSMSLGGISGLAGAYNDSGFPVVLGAMFRLAGIAMIGQSIRLFRGLPQWHPALLTGFGATTCLLVLYWHYVHENTGMRAGILALAVLIISIDGAFSMLHRIPRSDRLTHWSTGLVFVFVALFMSFRAIANLNGAWRNSSFSTTPVEIPVTVCANIAFIGCTFGMLLASNSRLRRAAEMSALYDPLTGLPNRRLFYDRLTEAEESARISGHSLGVIYLDLDNFKQINDTLGHQVGDELLKSVSNIMASLLREGDCLARVGGDEFVILAQNIERRDQLTRLAERVSATIEKEGPKSHPGIEPRASYGVALFPEDGTNAHDVMREADMEMYRTKRSRRHATAALKAVD